MKQFAIDWNQFLPFVDAWEQLSQSTRSALLAKKPDEVLHLDALRKDLPTLLRAHLIEVHADGKRAAFHRGALDFARALRGMERVRILRQPSQTTLIQYLGETFTREERDAWRRGGYYSPGSSDDSIAKLVASRSWIEGFLGAEDVKLWEHERMSPYMRYQKGEVDRLLVKPDVVTAARTLVRHLMERPDPLPFQELASERAASKGASKKETIGLAIAAAVRYALVFPALEPASQRLVLTLWPEISARLHRTRVQAPIEVRPVDEFHGAVVIEDLTTLLLAAAAEPLRLRADGRKLFARTQKALEVELSSLPEWFEIEHLFGRPTRTMRLDGALRTASMAAWLEVRDAEGDGLRAAITPAGQEWLARSSHDRLAQFVGPLRYVKEGRKKKSVRPRALTAALGDSDLVESDGNAEVEECDLDLDESALDVGAEDLDFGLTVSDLWLDPNDDDDGFVHDEDFVEDLLAGSMSPLSLVRLSGERGPNRETLDAKAALVAALAELEEGRFVDLQLFLRYHAEEKNPLLEAHRQGTLRIGGVRATVTAETLEQMWSGFLHALLVEQMLAFGGIRIGIHGEDRRPCFAVTDVGRYVVGASEDFRYGDEAPSAGVVVVQPNFEIVFLQPASGLESAIAPFAARVGRRVGLLFRLTRESVLTAAGRGAQCDQVLETLKRASAKALPRNVEHEIRTWFAQCRRVSLERTQIVRCPDEATAASVIGAMGGGARSLTDTIVEVTQVASMSALTAKLKKSGIFLAVPIVETRKQPARRRRRRWQAGDTR